MVSGPIEPKMSIPSGASNHLDIAHTPCGLSCASSQTPRPTHGAPQKGAPQQETLLSSPISQSRKPCFRPYAFPATLVARCSLTCAMPPYSSHRCGRFPSPSNIPRTQPSPQLRDTLPAAEPPPQHVQTPRKISLFGNHLPTHLVTRIVSICPSNTQPWAIQPHLPAARPSSPTKKYRPTGYS